MFDKFEELGNGCRSTYCNDFDCDMYLDESRAIAINTIINYVMTNKFEIISEPYQCGCLAFVIFPPSSYYNSINDYVDYVIHSVSKSFINDEQYSQLIEAMEGCD